MIEAIILAGLVFGICFLVDKGFVKVFRNQQQHRSGLSVRLNKRYGTAGIIVFVLGVAALFAGLSDSTLMLVCAPLLIIVGIGLMVYYMTFGIYYDEDGFVLTTFGKKSKTYTYKDIQAQQLYNSYGNIVIELYMHDKRSVQLQAGMVGVYPFLDYAFNAWLQQTGRKKEDCDFYNPEESCWFPKVEE